MRLRHFAIIAVAAGIAVAALASLPPHLHAGPRQLLGITATTGGGSGSIAHVQDSYVFVSGLNQSTFAPVLTGTTAGNFFVIIISASPNDNSDNITAFNFTSASNGATCTLATGTLAIQSNPSGAATAVYYCMNNPSSASVTFTFGFSSVTTNTVQATQAVIGEFSGVATTSADAGIGNTVLSTGSSLSIATTGSVPQTNDLVVSSVRNSASNPTSFGGSQIDFVNDPAKLATYQITTSGTITHTYTYGGSNQISATIAAFKHP